ncbi:MAG: hypothetical protein ABJ360_23515 [Roseobacter sp.]
MVMKKVVIAATCVALAFPAIAVAAVEKDKEAQSNNGYATEYNKTGVWKR